MHDEMLTRIRALLGDINMDFLLEANPFTGPRTRLVGRIIGYHLDNAFGEQVSVEAVVKGFQEYVLIIESFNGARTDVKFREERFNVASLLALFRKHQESLTKEFHPYMFFLTNVLEDARPDMHEPDNQGISMYVTGPVEFGYGDDFDPMEKTQEWIIKRETPHPKYGFNLASLPITVVLDMMKHLSKG